MGWEGEEGVGMKMGWQGSFALLGTDYMLQFVYVLLYVLQLRDVHRGLLLRA